MNAMHKKFLSYDTHMNIKLFIAKVIVNEAKVHLYYYFDVVDSVIDIDFHGQTSRVSVFPYGYTEKTLQSDNDQFQYTMFLASSRFSPLDNDL